MIKGETLIAVLHLLFTGELPRRRRQVIYGSQRAISGSIAMLRMKIAYSA
jgi:hypothetical protein